MSKQHASMALLTVEISVSRATLFQVDESSMVANLLWADKVLYYSTWGGSVN